MRPLFFVVLPSAFDPSFAEKEVDQAHQLLKLEIASRIGDKLTEEI